MEALTHQEQKVIRDASFAIFDYQPHEVQQKIHDSNARFKVAILGRRSGKTFLASRRVASSLFNPALKGWRSWIVAPNFSTTELVFREIWDLMSKHLPPSAITDARYTDQKRLIRTRWGSSVECKSADNEKALVGEELDDLIIDECAKIKRRVWEQHLRPTLSSRNGKALFITTPEGKNWVHGLYKRGHDPSYPDWESFSATNKCNPYGTVRADRAAMKREMTPEMFEQECNAGFVSRQGLVYKKFTHAHHVIIPSQLPKRFDSVMCGIDYGFVNPSALLVIGVKDSRYYVLDEHYAKEMFDKDYKKVLQSFKRQYNFRYCYADHDERSNRSLIKAGFKMRKARKDVAAGIEAVAQKMILRKDGKPSLFIVNKCKSLITELEGYSYHERKDTTNDKEEPVKNDDHACDALRYAIYTKENPRGSVSSYTPKGSLIYG